MAVPVTLPRDGVFRKAQASAYDGNCVEIAATFTSVSIRNSRDPERVLWGLSHQAFTALVEAVKADELR
jgi:hypothetical protein